MMLPLAGGSGWGGPCWSAVLINLQTLPFRLAAIPLSAKEVGRDRSKSPEVSVRVGKGYALIQGVTV